MVNKLVKGLVTRKQQGENFEIVMENPQGNLIKHSSIKEGAWTDCTKLNKVDYCAYGKQYRKSTHIWTTMDH